jgi:hypothetical protein
MLVPSKSGLVLLHQTRLDPARQRFFNQTFIQYFCRSVNRLLEVKSPKNSLIMQIE